MIKKIIASLAGLLVGLYGFTNPIVMPVFEFSELYFEDSDSWILEIRYYNPNQVPFSTDSLFMYSSTDSMELDVSSFGDSTEVFLLYGDSISEEFNINSEGDKIKLSTYVDGHAYEDILVFGDMDQAMVQCPGNGLSICKYLNNFMLDNSPTLGENNDTTGIYGTLEGVIYDQNALPVANKEFLFEHTFETDASGRYSTKLYAKPFTYSDVWHIDGNDSKRISIQEISSMMEPDSVIEKDIYLLENLASNIHHINHQQGPVKIYPNPVTSSELLTYEISLPIKTGNYHIVAYTYSGKLILKKQITNATGTLQLNQPKGIFMIQLMEGNQIISSHRIVKLDE